MVIHGLQKMTLLDFPGRVACTVFTAGCNFRCPFCHNALLVTELAPEDRIPEETVLEFLKKRTGLLDGVCVTGGEPLLQADIAAFLTRIREMGYAVKLDTNGSFPARLRALTEAGLIDYVAMDLKNAGEKYAQTVGLDGFDRTGVEESIAYLMEGRVDYEFRTTVVRELHTVSDIAAIAERIAGAPRYFLQCFTDSGNLIGEGLHAPERADLEAMRLAAAAFVPNTQLRGV